MNLHLSTSAECQLKKNWRIMTFSALWSTDKLEIQVQEQISGLRKVNQVLSTDILECKSSENELIKLKDKLEAKIREADFFFCLCRTFRIYFVLDHPANLVMHSNATCYFSISLRVRII
jgi:hypothetical protein